MLCSPENNAMRKCGKVGFVGIEERMLSISGIEVSLREKRQNEQKTERG